MTGDDNSITDFHKANNKVKWKQERMIFSLGANYEIRVFTSIPLKKHKIQHYTISENCKQLSAKMFHYEHRRGPLEMLHVLRSSSHSENKRLV